MTLAARALALAVIALPGFGMAVANASANRVLREGSVTASGPAAGRLYSCSKPRPSAKAQRLPWVGGTRWDPASKPVINGRVRWQQAAFSLRRSADTLDIRSNGFPVGGSTGEFPVGRQDDAWPFVAQGLRISGQTLSGSIPRRPQIRQRASCISLGAPVGIARDGAWIMPPADRTGRDLVVREVRDRCDGTVNTRGLYFYRAQTPCLARRSRGRGPSPLVGYARDGLPIYGPRDAWGRTLRNGDLDACHGRYETVRRSGRVKREYRYRLTDEFPYAVGCFRGAPEGMIEGGCVARVFGRASLGRHDGRPARSRWESAHGRARGGGRPAGRPRPSGPAGR